MKMKSSIYLIVAIVIIALIGTMLIAKDNKKADETITCPVSGETIAKSEAKGPVSYSGTDYYFCCNSCMKKFKENPEKFVKDANELKTICCGGMTFDKEKALKSTFEGQDYYFCSDKCKEKFDKDPKAYLEKVKAAKEQAGCAKSADCAKKCGAENAKACYEKK
ncbi:YHS domain-containing protein [candidate division KSB1 bacterium]|nr:YHS domain-containing protein [candidate division KSB1 bacterium]